MAHPLSLRLAETTIERLGRRARRAQLPPRTLAQRYVEEGLRMDEHPLVRFADGPAGRRARLSGTGKDVWEVIATVRDNDNDLAATATYLGVSLGLVNAAVSYYGAHREEIDGAIGDNEREAADAHAAWLGRSVGSGAVRLLLDEMLSPDVAAQRRERGHDVLAVAASEHVQLGDAEVLALACAQQRAVVTNNVRDFRPLHAAAVQPGGVVHFGMLFMPGTFRRTKADLGRIVTALERLLQAHPGLDDLADAEAWL